MAEPTIDEVIARVRHRLTDDGSLVVDSPQPYRLAWWPDSGSSMVDEVAGLQSDYGIYEGPKDLDKEFYAQLKAINHSLKDLSYSPECVERKKYTSEVYKEFDKEMEIAATAMNIWDRVIFPFRFHLGFIVRIKSPRDIFGAPVVDAMPVQAYCAALPNRR